MSPQEFERSRFPILDHLRSYFPNVEKIVIQKEWSYLLFRILSALFSFLLFLMLLLIYFIELKFGHNHFWCSNPAIVSIDHLLWNFLISTFFCFHS